MIARHEHHIKEHIPYPTFGRQDMKTISILNTHQHVLLIQLSLSLSPFCTANNPLEKKGGKVILIHAWIAKELRMRRPM